MLVAADKQQDDLRAALRRQDNLVRSLSKTGSASQGDQSPMAGGRLTKAIIDARYKHALELARSGNVKAALKELLWCYDEGFPRVSAYRFARNQTLLSAIAKLGKDDPEALTALSERRDEARKNILASLYDFEAVADFVSINRVLNSDDVSLTLYSQMADDDPRRRTLAGYLYDQFVAGQLYPEALQAKPYATMNANFYALVTKPPPPADVPNREEIIANTRKFLITSTASNVETLAGSGDLIDAQALAAKLLKFDGSPETQTLLQQHATRAGHPELLTSLSTGPAN